MLTGAYVFLADLSRQLRVRHDIAFIRAGSYGDSATPAAEVTVHGMREAGVAGRQVVVVEDVLDTGHTLAVVVAAIQEAGAASVRSCVLAVKARASRYPIEPDLVGFRVPDVFLVGYGIDHRGSWRHLPYLGFVVPAEDSGASERFSGQRFHRSGRVRRRGFMRRSYRWGGDYRGPNEWTWPIDSSLRNS